MSSTYEIMCKDCKQHYWCGQSSQGNGRLYSAEKMYVFLHRHMGHSLEFNMGEFMPMGYKDVEPELEQAKAEAVS